MPSNNIPEKMLIIGPAWVGDMVMAQVLFKLLKSLHPHLLIDVLAPAWTHALLDFMPEVQQGIVSPFAHGALKLWQRYQLGRELRACDYTNAIVLPNSFKSALVPYFANIPQRTGWRGEMRYGLLNDARILDKKQHPLMIQRFAALALSPASELPAVLPTPSLQVTEAHVQHALHDQTLSMPTKPVLGLCPGAEYGASKRWPVEYFAEVARAKLNEGWDVWIFGSVKDFAVAEKIQQYTQQRCVNLAGRTTLAKAVALMSLTQVVVTNDSGLMHVAAALDIPVIALYGSSSPEFTPPLSDKAKVLSANLDCSPCFKRECPLGHHQCMQTLSPEKVLNAFQ